jgi:hypothetical protein
MNWKNIDLESSYESSQEILDGYNFDQLLLEIECNLKDINVKTITDQFESELECRINSARDVFKNNLQNILKKSHKTRAIE